MFTRPAALIVLILGGSSISSAMDRFKGMSYTAWSENAYSCVPSDQSLAVMRADGVNTVSINVWEFQKDIWSSDIAPHYELYSASPDSVRHSIETAKSLGMKVLLKPNVDLYNDSSHWRGQILPSSDWFTAYHGFIDRWADLAQQEGVDAFSVGCELTGTQAWDSSWRSVVADVRGRFSGLTTFSANAYDEKNVSWWDAVDFIGIDAYYALTNEMHPTLDQLKQAWEDRAADMGAWRASLWPSKDIVFTETGYRSTAGANEAPWSYGSDNGLDLQGQADCYEALLSTMTKEDWWKGAFWWNWETDPNAGGLLDQGYTPQNKPAEEVLKSYYMPVPEPNPLWLIAGLLFLKRKSQKRA